jgi:oxygen-dependent protoporphyrinogen oxidase
MQVGVIGAGITGLSAALELRARGAQVTVFEASDRVGGVITTLRRDGFLIEAGPTSLTTTPALEQLIDLLDLESERVSPNSEAKRRYIVRDGVPVPLPSGPGSLVTTSALSASAKLRLLREPFVTAQRGSEDESVASLVRRRLGDEILTYMVNPLVAGIYAGNPERLSARHAMPILYHAERRHGSLILGGMKEARARAGVVRRRGITSFRNGLHTLPAAMAAALGRRVRLGSRATRIAREGDGWRMSVDRNGAHEDQFLDAIIWTGPAHALERLEMPEDARSALQPAMTLRHPPLSTLALGFKRRDVTHALDGFGVLCPEVEARTVLGVLFSSTVFDGRAPDGQVLITCFIGGERSPELGAMPLEGLLPKVLDDLRTLLGVSGAPTFVHHQHWPHAIPQYELGHDAVVNGAARVESAMPGLYLTGQWRAGVALGDCIAQGQATAARVIAER